MLFLVICFLFPFHIFSGALAIMKERADTPLLLSKHEIQIHIFFSSFWLFQIETTEIRTRIAFHVYILDPVLLSVSAVLFGAIL